MSYTRKLLPSSASGNRLKKETRLDRRVFDENQNKVVLSRASWSAVMKFATSVKERVLPLSKVTERFTMSFLFGLSVVVNDLPESVNSVVI